MKHFWTRSFLGQWITLMLLALGVSQVLFFFIYRAEQIRTLRELRRDEFLARAASVVRLVDTVQKDLHPEILMAANTTVVRFWLTAGPIDNPVAWQEAGKARLLESARPPDASGLPIQSNVKWGTLGADERTETREARFMRLDAWNGFGLALPIDTGLWLQAVYAKPAVSSGPPWYYYLSLGISILLLSLVTVRVARRMGRPLQRLTEAAERLGRGEAVPMLPEEGPDDLRRTAVAFNRMETRLRRFIEDRTHMMAAISHDLRTPITSMRLRAEFIPDADTRDKLIATLDEMKTMTEATLAFAREDASTEETRVVDITALLQSMCDDLRDLGWEVEFAGEERLAWRCRPDALRRALRNLIENAVRYGKRAQIQLSDTTAALEVRIEDDGPGIPPEDQERVFDPFVRLESSRNRSTGGAGLGLSIARTIIRSHGGDLRLTNRPQGGLRVVVELPRD